MIKEHTDYQRLILAGLQQKQHVFQGINFGEGDLGYENERAFYANRKDSNRRQRRARAITRRTRKGSHGNH